MRLILLAIFLTLPKWADAEPINALTSLSRSEAAPVILAPRSITSRGLPSDRLRRARHNLAKGRNISNASLRQLADLGDGNAAYRYGQRLDAAQHSPEDRAHYHGIALATGRSYALPAFLLAVQDMAGPPTNAARLREFKKILMAYVTAGDLRAVKAAVYLSKSAVVFPELQRDLHLLAEQGDQPGAGPLALHFAVEALQSSDRGADQRLAHWFAVAAASPSFSVRIMALNLQSSYAAGPN